MGKRKRQAASNGDGAPEALNTKKAKPTDITKTNGNTSTTTPTTESIQVVVGSYDRVIHGLSATIGVGGKAKKQTAEFADTFLFNAHSSMIRCVAVSPPSKPREDQSQKVFLASGSTDERINLYELSAHPPSKKSENLLPQVTPRPILESRRNREMGTLHHHESTVTALHFPTRSKLFSSSDDLTIAVTRTRDWQLLTSMKSSKPKVQGRPSGDTAPFGGTPAGVNDFAIHPSMKLMISVNKGERCMRLWDLIKAKKSSVLDFSRDQLQEVGESRHSTGEGRRIAWGDTGGEDGIELAVAFDRDVLVFGMDGVPKCRLMTTRTKVHHFCYVPLGSDDADSGEESSGMTLLAVSTEDGHISFHSTAPEHISEPSAQDEIGEASKNGKRTASQPTIGTAKTVASLGGKEAGVTGRIKDFVCIRSAADERVLYVVAGSSDGTIRLWSVDVPRLRKAAASSMSDDKEQQIGKLVGEYKTHDRVTCLTAFLMIPRPEGLEESEDELEDEQEETEDSAEDAEQ